MAIAECTGLIIDRVKVYCIALYGPISQLVFGNCAVSISLLLKSALGHATFPPQNHKL